MVKVLIATLYHADPVLLAATKLGAEKLVLLIDKKPDKLQRDSLALIKKSLGRVLDVSSVRTEVYDIVSVCVQCVGLIDSLDKSDRIYVNVTSGRKTKALGLLYSAYCRIDRVQKIAYNTIEDKSVVYLPKLAFKLTESQKKILSLVAKGKFTTHRELAAKVDLSRAMLYRAMDELNDLGYIDGFEVTDAGRIARL